MTSRKEHYTEQIEKSIDRIFPARKLMDSA